jgi:hypothetical protein
VQINDQFVQQVETPLILYKICINQI